MFGPLRSHCTGSAHGLGTVHLQAGLLPDFPVYGSVAPLAPHEQRGKSVCEKKLMLRNKFCFPGLGAVSLPCLLALHAREWVCVSGRVYFWYVCGMCEGVCMCMCA